MNLFVQELQDRRAVTETPAPGINQDKLIARGLQKEQHIGILGLAIALIAAVGFLSRRVEYAIVFAFVLSAILIALFLFI